MFVRSSQDDNYVGFIFGYVNNRKFYIVSWRPNNYNFDTTSYKGGIKGVHIAVSGSYKFNATDQSHGGDSHGSNPLSYPVHPCVVDRGALFPWGLSGYKYGNPDHGPK